VWETGDEAEKQERTRYWALVGLGNLVIDFQGVLYGFRSIRA